MNLTEKIDVIRKHFIDYKFIKKYNGLRFIKTTDTLLINNNNNNNKQLSYVPIIDISELIVYQNDKNLNIRKYIQWLHECNLALTNNENQIYFYYIHNSKYSFGFLFNGYDADINENFYRIENITIEEIIIIKI